MSRLLLVSQCNVKDDKLTRPKLSANAVAALNKSIPDMLLIEDESRTPSVLFFTDICPGQNSVSMLNSSNVVGDAVDGARVGFKVGCAKFERTGELGARGLER